MTFILASASPARRKLLREAGFRFRVVPSCSRETKRGTLREAVMENARRKAAAISKLHPDDWVLAADTMIEFRGRVYGKPRDAEDSVRLMRRLAGETHSLMTGVVLQRGKRVRRIADRSRVTFRPLTHEQIDRILRHHEATRFAGGYAIRRGRDPVVEKVEGSFTNVVGLPMEKIVPVLRRLASDAVRR